jgi:hypothetical protein
MLNWRTHQILATTEQAICLFHSFFQEGNFTQCGGDRTKGAQRGGRRNNRARNATRAVAAARHGGKKISDYQFSITKVAEPTDLFYKRPIFECGDNLSGAV